MAVDDATTLLVAIRELARDIEGDVPAGTATAGAANQITDTNDASPLRSDISGVNFWVPKWVYIHTGTANGDERKISASDGPAGTIDGERGFSTTPTTSSQYHIYPFSRTVLVQAINDSLSRCFHEDWILLTDVIDGDMRRLNADIATYWTASASNTISKVTTVADRVMGPQALRNQNTAANDYVKQASNIPVYQNRGYRVEAVGRIAVGTADLIVYNETNSKDIDSLSTTEISPSPGLRPFRLVIEFNTDTAEEITLRLGGVESTADVAWNYLALRDKHVAEFQLDRVIETPEDVSAIRWRKSGPHSGKGEKSFWHRVERGGGPGGVLTARVDHANYDGTGWAVCRQPYADLSADSDTTYCPQDWVVSGAAVELLRPLRGVDGDYERRYQSVLARHKRASKRYQVHLPNYPTMEEMF